jgi:ribosomal protein S6
MRKLKVIANKERKSYYKIWRLKREAVFQTSKDVNTEINADEIRYMIMSDHQSFDKLTVEA